MMEWGLAILGGVIILAIAEIDKYIRNFKFNRSEKLLFEE